MSEFIYSGNELELFAHAHQWKAYWKKQISPYLGQNVIDVGAGIGSNLALLWHKGAQWRCLEPDAALCNEIKRTAARLQLQEGDCRIHNTTLGNLSADEPLADTILYIDVLEHIEDDAGELIAAQEKLAIGGHLILLAPAHQWLYSPFDEAVGHYRRYQKQTLLGAAPSGLKLVRCRYLDAAGLLASAANKCLLKSSQPNQKQIAFWDNALVPASRLIDPLLGYRLGKTILAVWQRVE